MRLAVVSTPRSGNTWLRILASFLYQNVHLSVHNAEEVEWEQLPDSCVLQFHLRRSDELERTLRSYGFRTATLARHPLDVLVSILHFAPYAPTSRWLAGEGGDERAIDGVSPTSREFERYATSARARALLDVTPEWWAAAHIYRMRYERLVAEPVLAARRLCEFLDVDPVVAVESAVEASTIDKLRPLVTNQHFWRGRPGLWKRLLLSVTAHRVAEAQPRAFSELGYACDPDEALSVEAAEANWSRLTNGVPG